MSGQLILDVLTPTGPVAGAHEVRTAGVCVPGSQGELGILPDHIPFMTAIAPGVVSYAVDGESRKIAVNVGFLEVSQDGRLTILSDRVAVAKDVNAEATRTALAEVIAKLESEGKVQSTQEPAYVELLRERGWLEAQLRIVT